MYFSRLFHSEEAVLLHVEHLVSVLDLDNVIVGPNPEGLLLLHPHSDAADNADYLSERCKSDRSRSVRLDGKANPLSDQIG